jgi:hypothetical protein
MFLIYRVLLQARMIIALCISLKESKIDTNMRNVLKKAVGTGTKLCSMIASKKQSYILVHCQCRFLSVVRSTFLAELGNEGYGL